MKHRIFGNTLALFFVQIANYIVPLFVIFYLTSRIGVHHYGVLAFSQGILAVGAVILDFGFGLSVTEKISRHRGKVGYINRLIGGVWVIQFFLFIVVAVVISAYAFFTIKYKPYSTVFLFSLLPLLTQCLVPMWFFQGIERMKGVAGVSIAAKFVFAGLVSVFVRESSDYYWVPLLNGVSQFLVLLVCVVMIYRLGYRVRMPSCSVLSYCLKFTSGFFASRVAVASYMSSATIVLGLVGTPAAVAMYAIAEQLYKAMQSAFSPISQSIYPYMVKEKDIGLMFRVIAGSVLLAICGALLGYFLSPYLLRIFFAPSWSSSIPVLNVFFVAIVVNTAAVMTGYPLAATVNKIKVANLSVMVGAFFYIAILYFSYLFDCISPVSLAMIMIVGELYVLLHRVIVLMPLAILSYKNKFIKRVL